MWGTKLPKKTGGRYLITLQTSFGRQVRQAEYTENGWLVFPGCSMHKNDVLAWMKEPKPYFPGGLKTDKTCCW